MAALCARQCMTTYGTPVSPTSAGSSGSAWPPETSLTMRAPADSAAAAVDARIVSMLTTAPAAASAATTGSIRRRSSSALTRSAPGRVDSPPTSTMSAPSAMRSRPCRTARSVSANSPPSLNESGVTLTTPTTRQRSSMGSPRTCTVVTCAAYGRLATEDEAHRLTPGGDAVAELPAYGGRDRPGPLLAHAADRHAQVLGLDDDDDAARLQPVLECIRHLARQSFLHLWPAREQVDQPRELRQAGDLAGLVRDVADVRDADPRHEVVLAGAGHLDVLDQHHLVVIGVEDRGERALRMRAEAGEDLGVHARDAVRRRTQPVPVGVLADGEQDLADGGGDALLVDHVRGLSRRSAWWCAGRSSSWRRRWSATRECGRCRCWRCA